MLDGANRGEEERVHRVPAIEARLDDGDGEGDGSEVGRGDVAVKQ